jgi:hypothetical protein
MVEMPNEIAQLLSEAICNFVQNEELRKRESLRERMYKFVDEYIEKGFVVVCDETNNSNESVSLGELRAHIYKLDA